MDNLNLSSFDKISLDEMNGVSLMKRVDTKFILSESQLLKVFSKIQKDYKVLEIDNERLMQYSTLYFDTQNKKCFKEHHNGKLNRYKIRMRKYLVSDLCFLEVKKKNNLGVTNKTRRQIKDFETILSSGSKEFIYNSQINDLLLEPALYNNFNRITLVNKNYPERVTFSKYCLGITNTFDNIKSNRFKEINLKINKLNN